MVFSTGCNFPQQLNIAHLDLGARSLVRIASMPGAYAQFIGSELIGLSHNGWLYSHGKEVQDVTHHSSKFEMVVPRPIFIGDLNDKILRLVSGRFPKGCKLSLHHWRMGDAMPGDFGFVVTVFVLVSSGATIFMSDFWKKVGPLSPWVALWVQRDCSLSVVADNVTFPIMDAPICAQIDNGLVLCYVLL